VVVASWGSGGGPLLWYVLQCPTMDMERRQAVLAQVYNDLRE
jgi:hypothetical protein